MNRGVQIGALALCLGGLLSELSGQETLWRSVQQPTPPALNPDSKRAKSIPNPDSKRAKVLVRAAMSDQPGASLGLPVAISRGASGEDQPRYFPDAYRSAVPLTPQPQTWPGGVEPIATVPPPGAVIAASSRSAASPPALAPAPAAPAHAEPEEPGDLFASERPEPPAPLKAQWAPPTGKAPEILQVANWTDKYPVTAPDPVGPPPPETLFFPGMQSGPPAKFYVGAEYLLWWIRPDHAPPLVTTGDAQGGRNLAAGTLGQASTVVLDNGDLTHNPMSGARFYAGYYLDCEASKAIEVGGFFLGSTSNNFMASSAQYPVLARPFFNLNQQEQSTQLVAFPGIASGNVRVSSPSSLAGAEANLLCQYCCGCDYRISLLAGFRFLDLKESLTIVETVQNDPGQANPFNGTLVTVTDSFATRNQFYGGQVGVEGRWYFCGKFSLDGRATLALGDTHETLIIAGSQMFPPGTPNVNTMPGGLLALNSNIGTFSKDVFSVVPEVRLNLGYNLTDNIRASVGYNFLFWSNVIRPGQQIDTNIDITRIPNFAPLPPGTMPLPGEHPGVLFKESSFYAQGLTVGLEITW